MTSEPLYRFTIPGLPVAKGRARHAVRRGKGGKPILTGKGEPIVTSYTPENTRNFEAAVAYHAKVARAERLAIRSPGIHPDKVALIAGPLDLFVLFRFPISDSWPKWKRAAALAGTLLHTKKPDCSNLVKAIEDACNAVLWKDDGQVCGMVVDKVFAEVPGVDVTVFRRAGVCTDASKGSHDGMRGPASWTLHRRLLGIPGLLS